MTSAMNVRIVDDRVEMGEGFAVSFQRTLRVPEDGREYPLPPALGRFPVLPAADYAATLPPCWGAGEALAAFIPMYQREAMWLAFEAVAWMPRAVKVGVGRVNALTGAHWDETLHDDPQDYLVAPTQPWLDGINAGDGVVRQFVAMPLGMGYTIEAQLSGQENSGGVQILVYEPHPGLFPDQPPPLTPGWDAPLAQSMDMPGALGGAEMGIAAGGRISQKIYPDPHSLAAWDQSRPMRLELHFLNSQQYQQVTGCQPPDSPVDAWTYTRYGFPWFELYDEPQSSLPAASRLDNVRSVGELDAERGLLSANEAPLSIDPAQKRTIPHHPHHKTPP
jgi:hypothetical protein